MLTSCVGVKECSHWQRFVEMAQLKVGTAWATETIGDATEKQHWQQPVGVQTVSLTVTYVIHLMNTVG